MIKSECSFEHTNNFNFAYLKFDGKFDADGASHIVDQIASMIALDYDGYLIIDISEMIIALSNDEIENIIDIVTPKRFYFRRRTAFLIPEGELGLSSNFYTVAFEREGIVFQDFYKIEDAINWLSEPES